MVCQQPPVVRSQTAITGSHDDTVDPTTGPWQRHSEARATRDPKQSSGAEAPHALDVADCDSAPSWPGRDSEHARSRPRGMDRIEVGRGLDHRAVARPGLAVISSLPARSLPPIVCTGSEVGSEEAAARPRERERGALAGRHGSRRQQAAGDSRNHGNEAARRRAQRGRLKASKYAPLGVSRYATGSAADLLSSPGATSAPPEGASAGRRNRVPRLVKPAADLRVRDRRRPAAS